MPSQPNYTGEQAVTLRSFAVDAGGLSETLAATAASAKSAAIDAGSALVSPTVDVHVRQGIPGIESGTIVAQDGGTEADTLTVGTIVLTLDDTPANENQVPTEATAAELAAAIYAAIIAHSTYATRNFTVSYVSGDTINVLAKVAGDSLTLEETGGSFVVATTPDGPIAVDDGTDMLLLGGNTYRLTGIDEGNALAFIKHADAADGSVSITPGA